MYEKHKVFRLNLPAPSGAFMTKSIKAIRKALDLAAAQKLARQLESIKGTHAFRFHPINNPHVHWSGVSQRTLDAIRANREALRSGGTPSYVPAELYYNPRYAPAAECLVEHDRYGLGIVYQGVRNCANTGMTVQVYFEDADKDAYVFCDELTILDGELRGMSAEKHERIASEETLAKLDAAQVAAAAERYADDKEDEEDAAFAEFLANEFEE
jgi:hypothetical protein